MVELQSTATRPSELELKTRTSSSLLRTSTLTRKSTLMGAVKIEKNFKKSYLFSTMAALCLGVANYIIESLSARLGLQVVYSMSYGFVLTAILYYIFMYGMFLKEENKKAPADR